MQCVCALALCVYMLGIKSRDLCILELHLQHPMHACTGTGVRMFILQRFVWVHSCSCMPECASVGNCDTHSAHSPMYTCVPVCMQSLSVPVREHTFVYLHVYLGATKSF